MRYQLAAFDFDGTLADTLPWVASILNEVADRYGIRHIAESEYDLLRSYNVLQIAKYFSIPPLKIPAIAAYVQRRMSREIDAINLVPGIPDALHALNDAGVALAVVSSNAENNVRQVLGPELSSLMMSWECGVALLGKPSKLRHVLRIGNVAPDRAIYLGDEIRDIEAAQSAGMASGAVTWGYNSVGALAVHHPTVIFETVDAIVPTILGDI